MRLLVVAVLMLAVPVQAVAAIAAELCLTLAHEEAEVVPTHDHSAPSAHDQAAHDHANDASGSQHCGTCVAASISAAAKVFLSAVRQAGIMPALLPSPGNRLPRELDRPPLAL